MPDATTTTIKMTVVERLEGCGKNTHVDILLQENDREDEGCYLINNYQLSKTMFPANVFTILTTEGIIIDTASLCFQYNGSMDDLIKAWCTQYNEMKETSFFGPCCTNCADVANVFLSEFAGIEIAGNCSKPVTCNFVTCCCVFLPSFLQPCSIPGRTLDLAKKGIAEAKHQDPAKVAFIGTGARTGDELLPTPFD